MMTKARTSRASALASLLAAWLPLAALGATPVGEVTHLSGLLSVKRADGAAKVLSVKSAIEEGDLLSTEHDTYARLKFKDGGEIVLRPATQMKIDAYAFNEKKPQSDNIVLNLLKGGLRAVTGLVGKRNRDNVSFKAPTATIGIRGTHFGMLFCNNDCGGIPTTTGVSPANGLHLDVAAGAVLVTNPAGQALFNSGQFGYVANPQTPPIIVPPQQGIQVTMPSSISDNKAGGRSVGSGDSTQCAP
jgi:hypothetical protein